MAIQFGPSKPPPSVTIGTQTWMLYNLNVTTYRDGTPIPEVQSDNWIGLTTGAWCYYNNFPDTGDKFGKLYNAYAVNDPRGLAPIGYHIPSDAEIITLFNYLGGNGGALKEIGTIPYWNNPNIGATNSTGWSGRGGGYKQYNTADSSAIGIYGLWWTTTPSVIDPVNDNRSFYLVNNAASLTIAPNNKNTGLSVRCIKD